MADENTCSYKPFPHFTFPYPQLAGFNLQTAQYMSDAEMVASLASWVNKLIDCVNCGIVSMNEMVDAFNALQAEWENVKETFGPEIQEAVDEYFASTEFTAKLTQIVEGELADIVIQGFSTAVEMQAAGTLNAGYAQTLGFQSVGDGGAGFYSVSSGGTANGMDVLSCQGGLTATLLTPHYVSLAQLGCQNGSDATTELQRAIAISSGLPGCIVYLNGGTYTLSQPIEHSLGVRFYVEKYVRFNTTYSNATGGALWTIDNSDVSQVYYQNPAKMGPVFMGGEIHFDRNNSWYDTQNNVNSICMRITCDSSIAAGNGQDTCGFSLDNVYIQGYGCAVEVVNTNTYLFTLNQCYIEGNTVGIRFDGTMSNAGEEIRIVDSTFGHCCYAVWIEGVPLLAVSGTSFDFCSCVIYFAAQNIPVYLTGCHIEGTGRVQDGYMWGGMSSQAACGNVAYNASPSIYGPNYVALTNTYLHFNDGVQALRFNSSEGTARLNQPNMYVVLDNCFYSSPTAKSSTFTDWFLSTTEGVRVVFRGQITQPGINRSILDNAYAYSPYFNGLSTTGDYSITDTDDQNVLAQHGLVFAATNSYVTSMTVNAVTGEYGTTGFEVTGTNGTGGRYSIDLGEGPLNYMIRGSVTHDLTSFSALLYLVDAPGGWSDPHNGVQVWQSFSINDPSTDVSNNNYEWDASTKEFMVHEKVPVDTKGKHLVLELTPYRATDTAAVGMEVTYLNVTPVGR